MRMRSGRPPTLWCDLMVTDGPPVKRDALDHVGIERALREEVRAAELLRLLLEHLDEQPADGLALHLGIGRRRRARRGTGRAASRCTRRMLKRSRKVRHHLLGLAGAQQAVVDEDAGELVADRLVDQHRGDRGIDAAGQAADHPPRSRPGARMRAISVGAEAGHGPVAGAAGDRVGEVAQQLRAVRRVHHLRVEHQRRRSGARRRRSPRTARPRWRRPRGSPAAGAVTRSPWLIHTCSRAPGAQTPSNSAQSLGDVDEGAAELAMVGRLHVSPPSCAHIVFWP